MLWDAIYKAMWLGATFVADSLGKRVLAFLSIVVNWREIVEFAIAFVIAFYAVRWLHKNPEWAGTQWQCFSAIARRPVFAIAIAALVPVLLRIAILPLSPVPYPMVSDEFSHLLLAHTIADGRLSNPTPPSPEHFETLYVLMRPTYSSVYPPGQALSLAFGILIFGHPWAGVLLNIAFMAGAIIWMLRGWTSPEWALIGWVARRDGLRRFRLLDR